MSIALTNQQQAVVEHNHGAALVFAVAGAGKTTAMVHRIERLVREGIFSAEKILATSFGKMNERDLRQSLTTWPSCSGVKVSTLHALSFNLVKRGRQRGLLKQPSRNIDIGQLNHTILNFALGEAATRNVAYRRELFGIDRQDFLDYVAYCKSNLAYASLSRANLPASAAPLAKQASAPSAMLEWYLDFYRLFEDIRRKSGWITFDDMLMTGWELLHQDEELLREFQQRFDCVMVDEFQDINLAQSEMLDMLTAPHRNYMAIGDDDQTIYEWRGANPSFILDFAKRYNAANYLISDNFRCPAGPLVLANRVIRHNKQRQPKQLHLTKGFIDATELHIDQSIDLMAQSIVQRIETARATGRSLNDMAVLVRLNAQTPPIEQKLIASKIPYVVSKPFYERLEIKVLIAYCRLAWCERRLKQQKPLSARQKSVWRDDWELVHNRPKRYLSRELRQSLPRPILERNEPLANTLFAYANSTSKDFLIDKLEHFGDTIDWLATQLDNDAHDVLAGLDLDLGYQTFLRENTGSLQVGEGRAISVQSFIEYAKGKGSIIDFMQHIRQLAQEKIGRDRTHKEAVTVSTIHQAKGLEWPIVIVPNCNQGILPFTDTFSAEIDWKAHVEEERRLFYVALTRSQEQLHLHTLKTDATSQFISEARIEAQLATLQKLQSALNRDLSDWQAKGARAARDCQTILKLSDQLSLNRYFLSYWQDHERKVILQQFATEVKKRKLTTQLQLQQISIESWSSSQTATEFPGIDLLLENRLTKV